MRSDTQLEQLYDLASLMRSHPDYDVPEAVAEAIKTALESGRLTLLD